jgi:acyl carrier protein
MQIETLNFVDFVAEINTELGLPLASGVSTEADLAGDLGLDSLQTLELICVVQTAAGAETFTDAVPQIFSLGDLYAYYLSLRGQLTL